MVKVTLRGLDAERSVHWPKDYSSVEIQHRACRAFGLRSGEHRAKFVLEGRVLHDDSLPFLFARRHSKATLSVSFEKLPGSQRRSQLVEEDDVSSGVSTPSAVAEEIDRLDIWGP